MQDIKVVELATVLAGPHVGMFFAELGAQVVKIEHPIKKDVTRSWKLENENPSSDVSAYFSSVNYNKKYVEADLNKEKGRDILHKELENTDVLLVNFKKGSEQKLGINYSELRKKYPRMIIGHITGFGDDDDRVAYDLILQAESGFMSINGTKESGPLKMPVAFIDVLAGHQLKEAILLSLLERVNTGKGAYIEVSLYETAVSSLVNQATNWLMGQKIPERIGSLHPNIAPYGEIFITQDQVALTFAIGSQQQFEKLCELLGAEEIITNVLFSNNQRRIKNRVVLKEKLSSKISKMYAQKILQSCREAYIPVGQIKNIMEVFEDAKSNNLILSEEIEGVFTKRVKSFIAHFSD